MNKELEILKKLNKRKWFELSRMVRQQAERLIQGEYRYGSGKKEQKYLTRLKLELQAYDKTGNREHLINACNYCILETIHPQHKNHHYNDEVESVTRSIVAWNKNKKEN